MIKAKQLKQGYTYNKNNYTVYYSYGRYFFNAIYINESAYTLKELKEIVLINHNIKLI